MKYVILVSTPSSNPSFSLVLTPPSRPYLTQRTVYNISILSNIPLSTFEILPANKSAPHRLRPLFTVGVHDIPFLAAGAKFSPSALEDHGAGWVACTTDSILATKDTLCDMLITMPPAHAEQAREHVWPTVEYPRGAPVKATQRDLRRYRSLRAGLSRLQRQQPQRSPTSSTTAIPTTSRTTTDPAGNQASDANTVLLTEDDERALVEPLTWAALAYSGFMWWASAGEQARSDEAEEAAHDAALLAGLSSPSAAASSAVAYSATTPTMTMNMSTAAAAARRPSVDLSTSTGSLAAAAAAKRRQRASRNGEGDGDDGNADEVQKEEEEEEEARVELATIAYFHRLTTQILTTLAEVVLDGGSGSGSSSDDDDDDDDPDSGVDEGGGEREGEGEDRALLGRVFEEGGERGRDDDEFVNARRRGGSGGGSRGRGRGGRGGGGGGGRSVGVGSQAMGAMGLDVWSAADAAFVVAAVERYFGRRAHVEGKVVEVCGVRVC